MLGGNGDAYQPYVPSYEMQYRSLEMLISALRENVEERAGKGLDLREGPELLAGAEEALRAGELERAGALHKLAVEVVHGKRSLRYRVDYNGWLLETLALFEEVPATVREAFSTAVELFDRGDYAGAMALVDGMQRTSQNRLLEHRRELWRYTKRLYKDSRDDLGPEDRRRAKELMGQARSGMGSGVLYSERQALHLVREVHLLLSGRSG